MKYLKITIIILVSITFYAELQAQRIVRNFSLPGENIQNVNLSEIQGEKLTVIDFWTSWCKPCINAIPEMIKLQEKYQSEGVAIIGINADGPRSVSKALPLARSMGVNYPILFDTSGDLISEFNITAFPTLLILNSKREIIFTHEGFRKGEEKLLDEAIAEALKN
jgi:thiol-disulfide isomerase/thioredoxin